MAVKLLLCALVAGSVALRVPRRRFLASGAALPGACAARVAGARNLPESTGAKGDNRGTVAALAPIAEWRRRRAAAEAAKTKKLDAVAAALAEPPRDEKSFKRLFDEYSSDTKQFGFRNDAWAAVDDARRGRLKSEPAESPAELVAMLGRATAAMAGYLALAPPEDVAAARKAGR
ncbi:hypothetical protein JL720_16917 [Aureococcus anophagefferens]|nr:hypothetical protein JL720_16917 [Aureococcus anophagefferens]